MLFKLFSVQTTYCQTPIYLWSERDVVSLLPVLWEGELPTHCRLLRANAQGPRGRLAWGFGGKPWTVQWVGWVGPAEAAGLGSLFAEAWAPWKTLWSECALAGDHRRGVGQPQGKCFAEELHFPSCFSPLGLRPC